MKSCLENKIKHINRLLGHSLNVINSPAAPKWPPWIKLSPYLLYSLPGLSTSSNPLKVELVSPCLALGTVFRYQKSHWGRYAYVGHSILVLVFMDFFFLFLSSQAKALWYTSVIPVHICNPSFWDPDWRVFRVSRQRSVFEPSLVSMQLCQKKKKNNKKAGVGWGWGWEYPSIGLHEQQPTLIIKDMS